MQHLKPIATMSEGEPKPLADNDEHAETVSVLIALSRSLGNETVTLIVGKKRKEFTVHKQLLCDSCGYFRGAFDGSFKEGQEGKIYLVEESEGAVAIFVEWLYQSRIRPTIHETYLQDLFKLYVMAEKIILDELADQVMDAIFLCFSDDTVYDYLTTEMANYMWENTQKKSPMRTFIMEALGHIYYRFIGSKDTEEEKIAYLQELWPICKNHPDFFAAFFANFRGQDYYHCGPAKAYLNSPDGFCRFHCHEKGYECAAIKDRIWFQIQPEWDPEIKKSDFFHDLPDEKK
ncbi:50s ribosomal l17 protein [Rutstroemia sp. NJR-2017a BVV2]|nr:50s ribosomal l17 protein [Rutstroemia sp. NJR-2017a BVV2]PQE18390.1 50s ribosomal l17 protein [Rutstroemia sp. NJR-2017a BVV2]